MKLMLLISLLLSFFACSAFAILSPGYGVGSTDYDWQSNGSMKKTVCLDALHGVHVVWTYRVNGDQNSRRAYYNYKDETGAWAFGHDGMAVTGGISRFPTTSSLSDGRPAVAYVGSGGAGLLIWVWLGGSQPVPVDSANPFRPFWPGIAVGANDVIHVMGTGGDNNHYYSRSTDYGRNWTAWLQLTTDGIGGGWFSMTARESKVAIVWPDNLAYNVWIRESTDSGVTWGAPQEIYHFQSGRDSVLGGWLWQDALYDPSGNLHVVTNMVDSAFVEGIVGRRGFKSLIGHWSQATGWSVVRPAWRFSAPGGNHSTVSCPQLGYNSLRNQFRCTWVEFTLADTSTEGFSNGEVWGAFSNDNGLTWRGQRNITNSPTPGAPPGLCADDRYASLAAVVDDTVRVLYLSSFAAGSALQDGTTLTQDTMRYYQVPVDSFVGVSTRPPSPVAFSLPELRIVPNPFTSFATVPGRAFDDFALYDVSGRKVGTYKGDRVGADLPPGVYFLRPLGQGGGPLRVVKVR